MKTIKVLIEHGSAKETQTLLQERSNNLHNAQEALIDLLEWATNGNREGNPYCKVEVQRALKTLSELLDWRVHPWESLNYAKQLRAEGMK